MNQVVINDFCKIDIKKSSVVTIGKFDGVHKGHQKLIKYTVNMAKKYNLLSVVMMIRKKNVSIYNMEENISFIKALGVNYIIVIDFLPEFYTMEAKEFFNRLIEYYKMKRIVIGEDFAFGKDRVGDIDFLKRYALEKGVNVNIVNFLNHCGDKVSSSKIRDCLSSGEVDNVSKMLGRNYSMSGIIIHGNALGRKIGYPTANLRLVILLLI